LISIVIPALNEAEIIVNTLLPLQAMRKRQVEIILVDGGSTDTTIQLATPYIDQLVESIKGRALQMNAGAEVAQGDALWFLHADTVVPDAGDQRILQALQEGAWGRFDVRLSGERTVLRVVEWWMNQRSCWSGISTGDQGIFIQRKLFKQLGGFPQIPLMEDIELSRKLKKIAAPACIHTPLITSSRRWEERGVMRTILLMWWLRLSYWAGVSPQRIAHWYR
jgi:rSAM/selenodomain-associated transferase 2